MVARPRPSRSIRSSRLFSPERAMNATDRLSGDQKGCVAPSVPGKMTNSVESSDRRASRVPVARVPIATTTCRPSGEIAAAAAPWTKGPTPSRSSGMSKLTTSVGGTGRRIEPRGASRQCEQGDGGNRHPHTLLAAGNARRRRSHLNASSPRPADTSSSCWIQRNSAPRSAADCHRSSGSFDEAFSQRGDRARG